MKKFISYFLTLFLSICLFSACSSPKNSGDSTTPPEASTVFFESTAYGALTGKTTATKIKNAGAQVEYATSDPTVATVDKHGVITGVSKGEVTLTAKTVSTVTQQTETAQTKVFVDFGGVYQTLTGNEAFVKWTGRTFFAADTMNCFNTASGFEVEFYGTKLAVLAESAGTITPQLTVLVDDETDPSYRVISLGKTGEKLYTLISGLQEGVHLVRVYNIVEPYYANVAFGQIITDGYFTSRPADKDLKIEAYGDSITAGWKNMRDTTLEPESLDKAENGCMTYAWLAAQALNADINVFARSGVGLYQSLGNAPFTLQTNYASSVASEINHLNRQIPTWDFSSFIPDIVLINIGTNDVTVGYNFSTYYQQLKTFAEQILIRYGEQTKIILCYNAMIGTNEDVTKAVADALTQEGKSVFAYKIKRAVYGHPDKNEHKDAAIRLTSFIQNRVL